MDLSLVISTFSTLGMQPPARLSLLEAQALASAHVPPVPADIPLLITGISTAALAEAVQIVLQANFPPNSQVQRVHAGSQATLSLASLASTGDWDALTCLYVPALPEGFSFESFAEVIAHLRAPDGCPWDREQTHASLRSHMLQEAYEALSAMDSGQGDQMREEFGDLLLQIVLNSQIGSEQGSFTISQVIKGIYDKIIRRHPHIFGELQVSGAGEVLQNWERLKEAERKNSQQDKGMLDGVPAALPALTQAQEYQERAARVGFDWPEIEGVLDKIVEEIREVQQASEPEHVAEELGDLFFALVNLSRWRDIDAESALRGTNLKFKKRFAQVEAGARAQGRQLSDLSLDEMESFWQAAKKK